MAITWDLRRPRKFFDHRKQRRLESKHLRNAFLTRNSQLQKRQKQTSEELTLKRTNNKKIHSFTKIVL